MTFADLLTELETCGALTASRVKDMKTSLRYLAAALGAGTLEQCPVTDACRDPATWGATLDAHFQALTARGGVVSAHTRRNTRNNLRTVLRLAAAHGLLAAPPPAPLLTKPPRVAFQRQARATAPYQSTYHPGAGPRRYGLPPAQWPPDIQAGWQAYRERCGVRLRATSFVTYEKSMATYLGYLTQIRGRTGAWEELFDVATVREFLRWHGARLQRPLSVHGMSVVIMLATVAVVIGHPNRRALADFRNSLPTPTPLHSKRAHWVPLATLEAVAEACLTEGRLPYVFRADDKYPGSRRASQFQRGLMLKLLVRVPLRQRNVREIRLGQNLYQDQAGHWHLHFSGSELKIGTRKGRANEYHVDLTDYCPDFLPPLDEFLTVYRPRLPKAAVSPFLFLTYRGNPFAQRSVAGELSCAVGRHTGQRFYPHLIRTIWATEFLQKTGDFTTAATMLGDTLQVVMATYYDVVHKDQHAKARAFLGTALQTG
jgi:hypothetical protein